MPITFNCPCGKILSSRDSDAGLKAVCPSCGRRVIVPGQIQTAPSTKDQLRKAALEVDYWIQGHQRAFWKASGILAVVFLVGVVAYKFWSDYQRQRIVEQKIAAYVAPAAIQLDPNANPDLWQTSFDSFAVAIRRAVANNELLEPKFKDKTISWEVTFDELLTLNSLYFKEADELRKGDHGILVWATMLPSQAKNAEKLVPGQKFILKGTIGPVFKGRSAEHPLGNVTVRPLECSVQFLGGDPAAKDSAPPVEAAKEAEPAKVSQPAAAN